jgi:hypothetical protein
MDETTRKEVAECLEQLADQAVWNPELWQRCYDLVKANWDNELLKYVHDDVIHYSGEFHSRNIFGFGVKGTAQRALHGLSKNGSASITRTAAD